MQKSEGAVGILESGEHTGFIEIFYIKEVFINDKVKFAKGLTNL